MRCVLQTLLALMVSWSTGPAVYGQVFENTMANINVPGIGPVTARVGVSPDPLVQCEVRSRFSAGRKLTTPLVAYLIVDRTEGVLRACHTRPFDKGPPPFQLHWRLNDAVVGHISFDKE
jgi:hypothetical protein